jgi:calcineurin-like phosphoesterase family protein
MTDFVTSDIHFGHANIMKFCPESRAFDNDVNKMNEAIIRNWNAMITPQDHTYILGDVAFCNWQDAVKYMNRLNGTKTLIVGNHDSKLIKSQEFRDCFVNFFDYHTINVDKTKVVMFHYPIAEWDQMHRGAVHLFGHLHGGKNDMEKYRCMDVGMDTNYCRPYRLSDAVSKCLKGEIKGHHNKKEM